MGGKDIVKIVRQAHDAVYHMIATGNAGHHENEQRHAQILEFQALAEEMLEEHKGHNSLEFYIHVCQGLLDNKVVTKADVDAMHDKLKLLTESL
jgi:hypothetical protein